MQTKIVIPPLDLIAALRAAIIFASTDKARTHINAVYVEPRGDFVRLVSTDGHRLWIHDLGARCTGPLVPFLLSRDDTARFTRAIARKAGEAAIARENDHVTLTQAGACSATARIVDATFPPYTQVIPSSVPESTPNVRPYIDARYLADAGRAFDLLRLSPKVGAGLDIIAGEPTQRGKAAVTENGEPVIILSPSVAYAMIVQMPMRPASTTCGHVAASLSRFRKSIDDTLSAAAE